MIGAKTLFNRVLAPRSSLIILLCVLIVSADKGAQAGGRDLAGRIDAAHGKVSVVRLGVLEPIVIKGPEPSFEVFVGDTITTGEGAGARISFIDDSFVNMGAQTALRAIQYIYEPDTSRLKAYVKELRGRARFILYKKSGPRSQFTVETPTALVNAVIADFVVEASDTATTVAALEGRVAVKNSYGLTIGNVLLKMNHKTLVASKTPPSVPETFTHKERKGIIKGLSVSDAQLQ